jgi:hypothetical protein
MPTFYVQLKRKGAGWNDAGTISKVSSINEADFISEAIRANTKNWMTRIISKTKLQRLEGLGSVRSAEHQIKFLGDDPNDRMYLMIKKIRRLYEEKIAKKERLADILVRGVKRKTHEQAKLAAETRGMTLSAWVIQAIEQKLGK